MRKILSAILSFFLALAVAFTAAPYSFAQINEVNLLWSDPMEVNDIAVSKDGNYIAAVNDTGVYFFASNDPDPRWWYMEASADEDFRCVAISNNGNYVVVYNNTKIYYFSESRTRINEQTDSTWTSTRLYGIEGRDTVDISDNGEYVVVIGKIYVFYFAGCIGRSGSGQTWTWRDSYIFDGDIYIVQSVDMSSDGKYIAVGTMALEPLPHGVFFYKDAYTGAGDRWLGLTDTSVKDVSVSDDGFAVAAVTTGVSPGTLYYWADSTNLSGNPSATWTNDKSFDSVDMSSSGDEVVAGHSKGIPFCLHFWSDARHRQGLEEETWIKFEDEGVLDVAISDDGRIIAATTLIGDFSEYKAYFLRSNGSLIGEFELESPGEVVSMSGDGSVVAVGGGLVDSLYVFRLPTPVGGELVSIPISNTMVLLMLITMMPALVIGFRLIKRY